MNPLEFVIVIVIAGLVFKAWETYARQKHLADREHGGGLDVRDKLNSLEQRVQVLERIVTDSQFDLRREFADLEKDNKPAG